MHFVIYAIMLFIVINILQYYYNILDILCFCYAIAITKMIIIYTPGTSLFMM